MPAIPPPKPRRRHHQLHASRLLGGGVDRFRVIALLTLITVTTLIWSASSGSTRADQTVISTTPAETSTTASTTMTSGVLASVASSTTVPIVPLATSIAQGNAGDSVRRLQDRLRAMHFDPGPSDGVFGPATTRAVWAYEKLVLGTAPADVTGVVSPAMWTAMNQTSVIQARRPSATDTHLEVYLPQQVAVLFVAGAVRLVTHISSGSGEDWCDAVTIDNDDGTQTTKGICGKSITPGGVYHVQHKAQGWKNAALGRLYNPVYFNYGIAVHGAGNVPDHPASHGCIRIPLHIAEYFPSLVDIGDAIYVFDGIQEPEAYGSQLPVFDQPDPNYTTTTTSPAAADTTSTEPPTTSTTPKTTTPKTTTTSRPTPTSTTGALPGPTTTAGAPPPMATVGPSTTTW